MNKELINEKEIEETTPMTTSAGHDTHAKEEPPQKPATEVAASADDPIICAIDHGYANIKTPTMCFPANVLPCEDELFFTRDILCFDGKQYIIGIGHKEFRAFKNMDEDYYILTLAAIAKEFKKKYVVQAKDTLWGIAKKLLGNGNKYKTIMTANGMTSTVIHKGDVLNIPTA